MPMPPIEFHVAMFRGDWDQARSQFVLLWLMEALCRVNRSIISQSKLMAKKGMIGKNEIVPPLYRAGVHYEREPPGQEHWLDVIHVLSSTPGSGHSHGEYPGPSVDCEDLACYRVAELRDLDYYLQGKGKDGKPMVADPSFLKSYEGSGWKKVKGGMKARPFAKWRKGPTGAFHYHALVLLPDGRIEDPSLVLGMGKEAIFAEQNIAERLKRKELDPKIQYAKPPDVMIVDPESPTGYNDRRTEKDGQIGLPGKDLVTGIETGPPDPRVNWKPWYARLGQASPESGVPAPEASPGTEPVPARAGITSTDIADIERRLMEVETTIYPKREPYLLGFAKRSVKGEVFRILNVLAKRV